MDIITPEILAFVNACPRLATAFVGLVEALWRSAEADASPQWFADSEKEVNEAVDALGRAAVVSIAEAGAPTSSMVRFDGDRWKRLKPTGTSIVTRYGRERFERSLYRKMGVRNGPTIDPISLSCGLIRGFTPAANRVLARQVASAPSREAVESLADSGMRDVSRSEVERQAQELGEWLERDRELLEDSMLQELAIPQEAVTLAVSVDRVSVPIEEPRPRPVGRPKKGAPKRPVKVAYRQAYVSCWTLYDAEGEPLDTVRYGRFPDPTASLVVEEQLKYDIKAILEQKPELTLVAVSDGAPEMLNILDRVTEDFGADAVVVDFWHATEYIAGALKALGMEVKPELERMKKTLASRRNGVQKTLMKLKTWKAEVQECPEELDDAIRYFTNKEDRMDYARLRKQNLPIGSGHVEATAKTLVTVRMKRAGARWKLDSGQHILNLRALHTSSDRLPRAIRWLVDRQQLNYVHSAGRIREIA